MRIDLDRALAPLAGDPQRDMERVLAALELEPEITPTRFDRLRWPLWVGAAAAAGLFVGWLGSVVVSPPGTLAHPGVAHPDIADTDIAHTGEPDGPQRGSEIQSPLTPFDDDPNLARLAILRGEAFVEGDAGLRALRVGDGVPFEQFVSAGEKSAAFVELPGNVEIRLHDGARVVLSNPRSFTVLKGEVYVRAPESAGEIHLDTIAGRVSGRGMALAITATADVMSLVGVEGEARFVADTGEERLLGKRRVVWWKDGVVSDVEEVDTVWPYVAWQVDLLFHCALRQEEAAGFAMELIDGLSSRPDVAARAEHELRRAGDVGAMAVTMALYELPADAGELRQRCTQIFTDVAGVGSLSWVIGLLRHDDPDVRVAAVRVIERTTAIESGHDAEFWRNATQAARYDAVLVYRERLRNF